MTVGLSIAAHPVLLAPSLRPFRARYPDISLHIIEGFHPTLEECLRDGTSISTSVPMAAATSLRELVGQDRVTTSITADASDEINAFFARHQLPPPRLAVRSQSALTLLTCLANSDLLAMVSAQWERFEMTGKALNTISVEEELTAPPLVLVRRSDLSPTPAALHLLDLMLRATSRLAAETQLLQQPRTTISAGHRPASL